MQLESSSEDVTMLEVCRVLSARARYAREKVRGNKHKIRVAHQESLPLRDCPPRTLLKQASQTSANKRVISGSDPAPLPSVMYFSPSPVPSSATQKTQKLKSSSESTSAALFVRPFARCTPTAPEEEEGVPRSDLGLGLRSSSGSESASETGSRGGARWPCSASS